jgi:hypothetical protein
MAEQNVPPALDHAAIAEGIGELKPGKGYGRVVVGGKTLAYLKKGRIAVPTALVTKAPAGLGSFEPEKSGPWSNVSVSDPTKARAILEYVVAKAGQA